MAMLTATRSLSWPAAHRIEESAEDILESLKTSRPESEGSVRSDETSSSSASPVSDGDVDLFDFIDGYDVTDDDEVGPDRLLPTDDDWVSDVKWPVRLRLPNGVTGMEGRRPLSVPTVFRRVVERFPDEVALRARVVAEGEGGQEVSWKEWTFSEYAEDVMNFAKGLISLGLPRFGVVCVLGRNSPEWAIAAYAAIHAGGVVAGLYDTDSGEQCQYVAQLTKASVAVVEDEKQAAKLSADSRNNNESLKIIQWKGQPHDGNTLMWNDVMALGQRQPSSVLRHRLRKMAVNNCCMIICTSGSTGNPKAAMLTHDYCVMTAMTLQKHAGAKISEEHFISFMPFNHASGSIFELFSSMVTASPMTFAPEALRGDLLEHLQHIRPTQMFAVPRHYEKLAAKVTSQLKGGHHNVDDEVIEWVRRVTLDFHRARIDREPTREEHEAYQEARSVFLNDFKRKLGLDRAKYLIAGGAPIHPGLVEFFLSLDVQIFQEYGLTEVGATNIEHPVCFAPGSVGPIMDGHRVVVEQISANQLDGEVLFDGRIRFMGYVGNMEKTMEMVDSKGRVRSGDLGHYDSKGRLFITGRIKDLIITSGGKKISPRPIEQKLQEMLHPAVSSVIVIGEGRKFISALFGLKSISDETTGLPTDRISPITEEWLKSLGSTRTSISDIISSKDDAVYGHMQNAIDEYNLKYAHSSVESIKKWLLLPAEFSQAGGELNNLLKLKRAAIEAKYSDVIVAMYGC